MVGINCMDKNNIKNSIKYEIRAVYILLPYLPYSLDQEMTDT
jgi:hypothetical protein